jgi:hypothetical protein
MLHNIHCRGTERDGRFVKEIARAGGGRKCFDVFNDR